MLEIDLVGLLVSVCLLGVRYPHYVLLATVINQVVQIIAVIFLHGTVSSVMAAGAFSAVTAKNLTPSFGVVIGGAFANYMISALVGGTEYEKTSALLSPFTRLKYPWAVINLRFAAVSLLAGLFRF